MSEEKIIEKTEVKEVEKKLDNPLVVHKKGDASYEESAQPYVMNDTHIDDGEDKLVRHRFRKEKRGHGGLIAFLLILVIIAGTFSALYFTGNIRFASQTTTSKSTQTTTERVTTIEELYQGTIVVKDVYIFVDGTEVNGISGLQKALKYTDVSTTAYSIIDENANSDFLNFEILPLLSQMGFYGSDTVITHKESTGLIAEAETTTLPPETTATTKKEKTTKAEE